MSDPVSGSLVLGTSTCSGVADAIEVLGDMEYGGERTFAGRQVVGKDSV